MRVERYHVREWDKGDSLDPVHLARIIVGRIQPLPHIDVPRSVSDLIRHIRRRRGLVRDRPDKQDLVDFVSVYCVFGVAVRLLRLDQLLDRHWSDGLRLVLRMSSASCAGVDGAHLLAAPWRFLAPLRSADEAASAAVVWVVLADWSQMVRPSYTDVQLLMLCYVLGDRKVK